MITKRFPCLCKEGTGVVVQDNATFVVKGENKDKKCDFLCGAFLIILYLCEYFNVMDENNTLIERLKANDETAYQQLFEIYFKRLHHFAERMVFDTEVAHDLVQDVFISLYENNRKLSAQSNLSAWLFVSVRNSCLKYLRDRKVEDRRNLLYVEATLNSESIEWIDDEELLKKIYLEIENLPDKCRQIAKMRFIKEMKFSEIASELSISENTAKVQVHRAISKIKEQLAADSALFVLFSAYVEYFLE